MSADSKGESPLIELAEVDEVVYCDKFPYRTALCYATVINNLRIVQALLNIQADPNLRNKYTLENDSPLFIALNPKPPKLDIAKALLTTPDIDTYHIDVLGCSIFSSADGNIQLILSMLIADPAVAELPEEEKKQLSENIANAIFIQLAEDCVATYKLPFIFVDKLFNFIVCIIFLVTILFLKQPL